MGDADEIVEGDRLGVERHRYLSTIASAQFASDGRRVVRGLSDKHEWNPAPEETYRRIHAVGCWCSA